MLTPHSPHRALALATALLLALAAAPLGTAPATAAPTDLPTSVEVPNDALGDAFIPGVRLVEDLPQDYVEEEYLVFGKASIYNYVNDPPTGPTDIETIQDDVDYGTRIIIRRPAEHGQFKGTVVIEWWNSTADFDTAPVWDVSAEYFAREGYIYVGVTNAIDAFDFLLGGCSLFGILPPTCGTRYAALTFPDDGLAYEMASQIATLLKSDSPLNPLAPQFRPDRIFHAGESQQAGSMVTYASAFHLPGVNDGYFVQSGVNARRLNDLPQCGVDPPFFPDCEPDLVGSDNLVRTDLPVPVVQAVGETDLAVLFGIGGRQPDTPTFRYYEMAGVAHLTIHKGVEIFPPITLASLCENELNTVADGPVFGSYLINAMWENLEQQVKHGRVPPAGVLMDTDENGVIQRDQYDNALGGVRITEMDVPTGSHFPPINQADPNLPDFLQFIGNLACFLGGSTTPFDDATLRELYPTHGKYVSKVAIDSAVLMQDGFLLPKDRQLIIDAAVMSNIGFCGLGFELAFVLPPLMWWRARRRRS